MIQRPPFYLQISYSFYIFKLKFWVVDLLIQRPTSIPSLLTQQTPPNPNHFPLCQPPHFPFLSLFSHPLRLLSFLNLAQISAKLLRDNWNSIILPNKPRIQPNIPLSIIYFQISNPETLHPNMKARISSFHLSLLFKSPSIHGMHFRFLWICLPHNDTWWFRGQTKGPLDISFVRQSVGLKRIVRSSYPDR